MDDRRLTNTAISHQLSAKSYQLKAKCWKLLLILLLAAAALAAPEPERIYLVDGGMFVPALDRIIFMAAVDGKIQVTEKRIMDHCYVWHYFPELDKDHKVCLIHYQEIRPVAWDWSNLTQIKYNIISTEEFMSYRGAFDKMTAPDAWLKHYNYHDMQHLLKYAGAELFPKDPNAVDPPIVTDPNTATEPAVLFKLPDRDTGHLYKDCWHIAAKPLIVTVDPLAHLTGGGTICADCQRRRLKEETETTDSTD